MSTLYCIIGPSGTGKTTLENNLKKEFNWLKSVESYTTRPKRFEQETGHIFISQEEFNNLKNLVAYTNFNGFNYGVTGSYLDQCDLYVIDLDGIITLKEKYQYRDIIVIGLYANEHVCKYRMLNRGDSRHKVLERLEHDKEKFKGYFNYCDIILDANQSKEKVLADFIDKVTKFEEKEVFKELAGVNNDKN